MHLSKGYRRLMLATGLVATLAGSALAQAADTIKVGILHSLSGTMAISETTLKDTMLMLIEASIIQSRPAAIHSALEFGISTRQMLAMIAPVRKNGRRLPSRVHVRSL